MKKGIAVIIFWFVSTILPNIVTLMYNPYIGYKVIDLENFIITIMAYPVCTALAIEAVNRYLPNNKILIIINTTILSVLLFILVVRNFYVGYLLSSFIQLSTILLAIFRCKKLK